MSANRCDVSRRQSKGSRVRQRQGSLRCGPVQRPGRSTISLKAHQALLGEVLAGVGDGVDPLGDRLGAERLDAHGLLLADLPGDGTGNDVRLGGARDLWAEGRGMRGVGCWRRWDLVLIACASGDRGSQPAAAGGGAWRDGVRGLSGRMLRSRQSPLYPQLPQQRAPGVSSRHRCAP